VQQAPGAQIFVEGRGARGEHLWKILARPAFNFLRK
jgi:hypothetical protein